MAQSVEMEVLQAQMVELRDQLDTLRIGEGHRGQSKDVSLVVGIKDWTGESKRRSVHEFLTQAETLAKVSGRTSQDKAFIVEAKLQGLALQFLMGKKSWAEMGVLTKDWNRPWWRDLVISSPICTIILGSRRRSNEERKARRSSATVAEKWASGPSRGTQMKRRSA
jgi:hypothetical protein